jgi:hypothetical protein
MKGYTFIKLNIEDSRFCSIVFGREAVALEERVRRWRTAMIHRKISRLTLNGRHTIANYGSHNETTRRSRENRSLQMHFEHLEPMERRSNDSSTLHYLSFNATASLPNVKSPTYGIHTST